MSIRRNLALVGLVCAYLLAGCSPTPAPVVPEAQQPTLPALKTPVESKPMSPSETMVERARADAASRIGAPITEFDVVSVEERDWPNSGLGCPVPGMMYAQVITPGFLIVLEGRGRHFTYHTDRSSKLILCEGGRPAD